MRKQIIVALVIVLVAIQFFRPEHNESDDNTYALTTAYPVPANIDLILRNACADCHSNKTRYPWYAHVQPVGWWMDHHINDGKKNLNLSDFTRQRISWQYFKLEEMAETVQERFMPLASYTSLGMHPEAVLTDKQRYDLVYWAMEQMDSLERVYPADSLVVR